MGIVLAIAAPAHVLLRVEAGKQLFKLGDGVLSTLIGMDDELSPGSAHS